MYENTLFPVDGSEDSSEILHHVGEFANWADAAIHFLLAVDTTRDSVTAAENTVVDTLTQEDEGIAEDINRALSTLGVKYETDVVQGNPAPTVVECADRYGHDLIAISIHGQRGVSRYLQDSVSEKVVRLSSVPVLVARVQPDGQLAFPHENVFITTDGSTGATRAAQHGLALAESLGATIHILSVVDDASLSLDIRSTTSGQEHEQAVMEAAKEIIGDAETYSATDTVRHIERGDPVDTILNRIDANDIHVVVAGMTGRCGTDRVLLDSATGKMVRSAPVPVLVIGGVE